jgi:hypothetical protein
MQQLLTKIVENQQRFQESRSHCSVCPCQRSPATVPVYHDLPQTVLVECKAPDQAEEPVDVFEAEEEAEPEPEPEEDPEVHGEENDEAPKTPVRRPKSPPHPSVDSESDEDAEMKDGEESQSRDAKLDAPKNPEKSPEPTMQEPPRTPLVPLYSFEELRVQNEKAVHALMSFMQFYVKGGV